MPLPTQQRLNDHLVRWDREIREFEDAVNRYGVTKADLEYERAVIQGKVSAGNPRLALSRLELVADADPGVHQHNLDYRAAEAMVEAKKARLRWCSAVADALRSEVSTERAEAQLYSEDRSTP